MKHTPTHIKENWKLNLAVSRTLMIFPLLLFEISRWKSELVLRSPARRWLFEDGLALSKSSSLCSLKAGLWSQSLLSAKAVRTDQSLGTDLLRRSKMRRVEKNKEVT